MKTDKIRKRDSVLEYLRSEIVERRFLPATQLPSREVLAEQFSTSKSVVQSAMAALIEDRLVLSRGASGTFVCDSLPYLSRYGLVFEWRPSVDRPWSKFWKTLHHEALVLHTPGAREFQTYFAKDERSPHGLSKALLDDVRAHRIAGLIFSGPPFALHASQALSEPTMPKVGIMNLPYEGIPAVAPDGLSFIKRAMDYLAERGRRRLAVVEVSSNLQPWDEETAVREATARGMMLDPVCMQACHFGNTKATERIVRLLMRLPAAERPDGLILADDNLVEPAVAGLLATAVRIPEDLDVVAHGNFPLSTTDVLPLHRLGFDCRGLLLKCVEVIDAERKGTPVPKLTLMPAVWPDELRAPLTVLRDGGPGEDLQFEEVGTG
jgi:DNA-binding LacI/PurR family transcriptional regulator